MNRIGMDCGTYNLVLAKRNEENNFKLMKEVNCFIEMSLDENPFVFNMMKNAGVPLIEIQEHKKAYVLGQAAIDIAYSMPKVELKRPMSQGCLNPKEKSAQEIMSIIFYSMLGNLDENETILYYSVPANAINKETDADYHGKVLETIFNSFEDDNGKKLKAYPINEALAIVYAELADKSYTGISVSCGAGQVNVCFAVYGTPVFQFSIVNSGDWIDSQSAKVTGETIAYINRMKTKINFNEEQDDPVLKAIKTQYEIMIQKTVQGIKNGVDNLGKNSYLDKPIDIVVSGGTASPPGFANLFSKYLKNTKINFEIGKIIKPAENLYSVAKGCLIAAENHK